jgi:hypothetical protein
MKMRESEALDPQIQAILGDPSGNAAAVSE